MLDFFEKKSAGPSSLPQLANHFSAEQDKKYAMLIDKFFEKIASSNNKKFLFGTRCEKADDIANDVASIIENMPSEKLSYTDAMKVVLKILQISADKGLIYATGPIKDLKNRYDLGDFICF